MGCCSSRNRFLSLQPWQEKAISYQESLLGYINWPFRHALAVLKQSSAQGKLTPNQFTSFASELELKTVDMDTVDSQLFRFYNCFKDKKGRFEAFRLTVLLALLCPGPIIDKAEGLFGQFPDLQAGILTTQSLEQLLTTVFDVALEIIPQLALADLTIPAQTLSIADLNAYLSILRGARAGLQQEFLSTLTVLSPSLSLHDFVSRVTEAKDHVKLGSARELRVQLGMQ